jgi:hypothetical protein
LSAIFNLP